MKTRPIEHSFNERGENIASLDSLAARVKALEEENERLKRMLAARVRHDKLAAEDAEKKRPTLH